MGCSKADLIEKVAFQLQDMDEAKPFMHWTEDQLTWYVNVAVGATAAYLSTSKTAPKEIVLKGPGCVFDVETQCQNVIKVLDSGNCETPILLTERQKRQLKWLRSCGPTDTGVTGVDVDVGAPTTLVIEPALKEGEEVTLTVLCESPVDTESDELPADMCGKYLGAIVQHVLSQAWDLHSDIAEGLQSSAHHFEKWKTYVGLDLQKDQRVEEERNE